MSSSGLRNQLDINKFELSSLVSTPATPQSVRIHLNDVDDVPGFIPQDVLIVGTRTAGDQSSGLTQHWQGLLRLVLVEVVVRVRVAAVMGVVEEVAPSLLRSLLLPTEYFWSDVSPESFCRATPDDFYFPVNVLHPPSHSVSQVGCWPKYLLQLPS